MEAFCIAQWHPCTEDACCNLQSNINEDSPIMCADAENPQHMPTLPTDRELELESLLWTRNNEICELNQRINTLLKNTLQPPERVWVVLKTANLERPVCGFLFVDIDHKTKSTTLYVKHHNYETVLQEAFVLPNQCNAWHMQTLRACPDSSTEYHSVAHFYMCGTLIFSLWFASVWDRGKFDSMMRDIF